MRVRILQPTSQPVEPFICWEDCHKHSRTAYSALPTASFCNNSVKVGRTLQPYPNYSNATIGNLAYGHQTYNALQVTSQYRIEGGGLFGLAYTWAKTMNDVSSYQNYNNHRGDRTVAGVPMRLVFNLNYPLPIGQGQRFLNGNNFATRFISGWAVNDITSYQHGGYLTLTTNTQNQLQQNFGAGTTRPNYVPGCIKTVSGNDFNRLNAWFNTSCFAYAGDYTFGNERANDSQLLAGIHNWDISMLKTTKITERTNLQFRIESFNTFNHFQPGTPNTAVGNGSYGKVTSQANNPPPDSAQPAPELLTSNSWAGRFARSCPTLLIRVSASMLRLLTSLRGFD